MRGKGKNAAVAESAQEAAKETAQETTQEVAQEPVQEAGQEAAQAPAKEPAAKTPAKKKRRRGHPVRNGIIAAVVVIALGVGGFFLWRYLNKTDKVNSQMMTRTADWSSIQSTVQGSGSARAKESAAITLENAGIVQSLYVTEGQVVNQGDPLYEIVSPAAQEALTTALDKLQDRQEALSKAQRTLTEDQQALDDVLEDQQLSGQERYVKAPFSGQLRDTARYKVGDKVTRGEKVALLVDDLKFRIPFYFSYAYENDIQVGQAVQVSVGGTDLTGTVEEVNFIRRVAAEGTILFEAVVVIENPGALTDGLSATCSLAGPGGVAIYPYGPGTLEYYRTEEIWSEAPKAKNDREPTVVESTALRDYADVKEGDVLLVLSQEDFSRDIESAREQVRASQESIDNAAESVEEAQKDVTEAQEALEDFSAVAPISGTVTSCTLVEGQEVKSGDTVITISNNTTMVVTIEVDDRNIAYVKPGMTVDLQSNWGDGGTFVGTVTKIDMSLSGDAMGSGMTNYPVTLEVDNPGGTLLEGMWLSYSFVTSQSDNCIVVPMQSVKYVSLEDGETASVIFIQADSRPENAVDIDIPELMPGETPSYPSEAEGFYPVAVETGLYDNYNVEITSGLEGGETVFVDYYVEQAWG